MKHKILVLGISLFLAVVGITSLPMPALAMQQVIIGGYLDALDNTATEYNAIGGGYAWDTTVGNRAQLIPTDGTLSRLSIELSGVPGTNPYVFTLYVDGIASALTVTVAAGDTQAIDTTHTVDVTPGQYVSLAQVHQADHPDNIPTARWSIMFEGDTANESIILGVGLTLGGTTTYYQPIAYGSNNGGASTESQAYQVIPTDGYLKKLYVRLEVDPGTNPDAYTFKLRVNDADSNDGSGNPLAVTIVADNTTGNDITHSIDMTGAQYVDVEVIPTDTPTGTGNYCYGMVFVADTDGESLILGQSSDSPTNTQTEYNYLTTTSYSNGWATQIKYQGSQAPANDMVLKKFYVRLRTAVDVAPDEWVFTVMKTGDTATDIHVHFQNTLVNNTQSDLVNTYTCVAYDRLFIRSVPTDSPAAGRLFWGLVCYIAVSAGEPDIYSTPSSKDFGVVIPSTTYWASGTDPELGSTSSTEAPTSNSADGIGWTDPTEAYGSNDLYASAIVGAGGSTYSPAGTTNGTLYWTNPTYAYSSNNQSTTAIYPSLVYTNSPTSTVSTNWTNPTFAYADDSQNATITSGTPSGSNTWGDYGFSLAGYTVTQVRVRYDAWSDGYSSGATYATKLPSSDGDTVGTIAVYPTTPATKYDKVDELVATTGDGIVVVTNNDIQLFYATSNFTIPAGATIASVSVIYTASDNATGTNKVTGRIKVNGTAYTHTTNNESPDAGTWTTFTSTWTQNPATVATWTVDEVNGVASATELQQFGVECSDATPDVDVANCYLRVDYTPATEYDDKIQVDVSWDGGSNWSTASNTTLTSAQVTTWYDVTSNTTWTPAKLANGQLKVRALAYTINNAEVVRLDWLPVEVTISSPAFDQIYGTFGMLGSATITKVEIGYEAFCNVAGQKLNFYTSNNSGVDWAVAHLTAALGTSDPETLTYIDVTADSGWTWTLLNDTNFKVKVVSSWISGTPTWSIDWIVIRVTANTAAPSTIYGTYGFSITDNPTKVEVGIEGYTGNSTSRNLDVYVSWDGGSTWSDNYTLALPTSDPDAVTWIDYTSNTTWTANSVNDTNLKTKITHAAGDSSYEYVDYIPVKVTYTKTLTDGESTFYVTNNGTMSVDITFMATDFTSVSSNWTLGAPDETHARLTVYISGASTGTALTGVEQELVSTLAASDHKHWELKLETPTPASFPDPDEKTSIITLTATVA